MQMFVEFNTGVDGAAPIFNVPALIKVGPV